MRADAAPVKAETKCAVCPPGALPIRKGDLGVRLDSGAVVCAGCFLRLAKGGKS